MQNVTPYASLRTLWQLQWGCGDYAGIISGIIGMCGNQNYASILR